MVSIVFFDVDGTLLSHKTLSIPPTTLYALKELQNKGIKLIAATGRGPSVAVLLKDYGFDFDGFITLNGQYVFTGDQILLESPLRKDDLRGLLGLLEEHQITCEFIGKDFLSRNFTSDEAKEIDDLLGTTLTEHRFEEPEKTIEKDVYQLNLYMPKELDHVVSSYMPNSRVLRWHPLFNDVISKEGGKHRGVELFLDYFGIPKEESLAFGDGGNDIDLLRATGEGVAMGNAADEVKVQADDVTASVDEDGIYQALVKRQIIPPAELWGALNEDESPAGFLLARHTPIPKDIYHLVVEVIVRHTNGKFLVVQRSYDKKQAPGFFEASASGSALHGETSLEAVKRELFEETGIKEGRFTLQNRNVYPELHSIFHSYLCETDQDPESILLQEGETIHYEWMDKDEFLAFTESPKMLPYPLERRKEYLEELRRE